MLETKQAYEFTLDTIGQDIHSGEHDMIVVVTLCFLHNVRAQEQAPYQTDSMPGHKLAQAVTWVFSCMNSSNVICDSLPCVLNPVLRSTPPDAHHTLVTAVSRACCCPIPVSGWIQHFVNCCASQPYVTRASCRSLMAGVHQLPVRPKARHVCIPGAVVVRHGGGSGGVHQDSSAQVSKACGSPFII